MRKKLSIALASVTAMVGGTVWAAGSGTAVQQNEGLKGTFSLIAMVHTTQYQGQDLGTNDAEPWDGKRREGGPYVYASIPCTGNAPVNNISTDLTTYSARVPNSRVPASTRNHPFRFDVVENKKGKLRLKGDITLTVCHLQPGPRPSPDPVPDGEKDKIFVSFNNVRFKQTSGEEVRFFGPFKLRGGTGIYETLRGEGDIAGYFLCFAPEGCTSLGEFRDGQYTLQGRYRTSYTP